ncbi:MAG TPA: hypothetical protein VGS07_05805 [Thermoanaerobaculia bacterium]|nr:hypothetical protein [Thermoanaerobaculia bacterium]
MSSSFGSEAKTAWFILLVGLGLAVAGVVQLSSIDQRYKQALAALQPQPPDTQIDAWFHESRDCLIMHAKNRLNLFGPESDLVNPLVIEVPTLDTSTYGISREDLSWHVGNDSVLRFSVHKFIIIYLTERHLAAYTCDYNFIRDISLNETTREYQYQDIVSVATYEWSSAFTLPTGQKLSTSQIFRLSVASGEYIEVRLDNDQLRKMTQLEEVPAIGADQAVTTIRALLRDRKGMAA